MGDKEKLLGRGPQFVTSVERQAEFQENTEKLSLKVTVEISQR